MKKTFLIILIIVLLTSTMMITAMAVEPLNIHDYPYWIQWDSYFGPTYSTKRIYSEQQITLSSEIGTNVLYGNMTEYGYNNTTEEWAGPWDKTSSSWSDVGTVTGGNYALKDYLPPHGEIVSPEGIGYTTYQDIVFTYEGFSPEDIWLEVKYVQFDGNDVNYIIGSEITHFSESSPSGYVYAADCPYGIGVNKIRLYGNYELLDEVWVTYQKASDISEAKIVGVNNGDVLEKPPNLSVVKNNYLNPVELTVNGHVYKSFTAETYTYLLARDWTSYARIGSNTVTLTDVWTEEVLDTFTFTVTRGSVDASGIYQMPDDTGVGGQGLPDAWGDLTDNAPVKPDSTTGTILDWIVYIGRTIGWVVEIGITAITEFGKDIGRALESLLSIFDPVFKFVSAIAGSIPTPIAVGIFAVFSVACVMAIIRFIKG